MTLTDRQLLHSLRMFRLGIYADAIGLPIKVKEWNRTIETQREYVDKGVSKTMDSRHLDGLATDAYIVVNGAVYIEGAVTPEEMAKYRTLGLYWESMGGRWGGRFIDHAEFKKKNGRDFDPSKDLGWDPYHFETTLA